MVCAVVVWWENVNAEKRSLELEAIFLERAGSRPRTPRPSQITQSFRTLHNAKTT